MNALHSKVTPRWGSPSDLVDRARRVMGGIDLDPCSEAGFQETVRAGCYYSPERAEDGLVLPWYGRVFCNPPGGLVPDFWRKAISGEADQVFWVGFSVEQLAILADEARHPVQYPYCVLRSRLRFTRHDGYRGSPSHANYVCGIGVDPEAFVREFDALGMCVV